MKKFKWFVFTNTILLLIVTLINVTRIDQLNRENARAKLEQAINEVPLEENLGNASIVKEKIKNDVSNSKIINEDTNEFPVYTSVDGYEFKVKEDGKIENVENIKKDEEITNNDIKNEVEKNEDSSENIINKNQTLVKYIDETKTDKGITISTTKEGLVTINGKSTEKLFIKISNNINITNNITKDFEEWKDENILLNKGEYIKQEISEIENLPLKGQINAVLRTEDNMAFGIIKTIDGATSWTGKLDKNIVANYIYIDKDIEINNMKFKIEITEVKDENTNLENNIELENKVEKKSLLIK